MEVRLFDHLFIPINFAKVAVSFFGIVKGVNSLINSPLANAYVLTEGELGEGKQYVSLPEPEP
tara:strand:+ start:352 stop:540 length:189 start_codon:yes stop_codon:yes gene_type:complete